MPTNDRSCNRRRWSCAQGLACVAALGGAWLLPGSLLAEAAAPYPIHVRQRLDVAPRFELSGGTVAAVAVDPDDRIYATGTFSSAGSDLRVGVLRYRSDGTMDSDYRPAPLLGGSGRLLLLLGDGRLVVAGTFSHAGGFAHAGIVRLLADGSVDPAFDAGPEFDLEPTALAAGPNGTLYVAGIVQTYAAPDYVPDYRVVRLASDGSRDATFDAGTNHFLGPITALAVAPDGSVYVNGSYLNGLPAGSTNYSSAVAHLLPSGSRDSSFDPSMQGTATAVLRLDTGDLLVGGLVYDSATSDRLPGLLRVHADGSRDATFQAGGFDFGSEFFYKQAVRPVLRQDDGRLVVNVVRTWAGTNSTTVLSRAFRLEADGALDASFAVTEDHFSSVVEATDGRLIAARSAAAASPVFRLLATGVVDSTFATPALRRPGVVNAVVPTADGRWVVGGDFEWVDGQARPAIARFNADFSRDDSFIPAKREGAVQALAALPDGGVLFGEMGVQFVGVPLVGQVPYPDGRVARIGADGVMDSGYGAWLRSTVQSILVGPNGEVFAGLGMVSPFVTGHGLVVRLNAQGDVAASVDETLDTQGAGAWSLVRADAGGLLTLSHASSYLDPLRVHRYGANGARDTTFLEDVIPIGVAGVLAPLPDGRVLFGWSTEGDAANDPVAAPHLARLNTDGTRDASFVVGTGLTRRHLRAVTVRTLDLQEDGSVVVAGSFDTYQTSAVPGLVRLRADGARDAAFAMDGIPATGFTGIHDLEFTADRSLLAVGEWNYFADTDTLGMGLVLLQPATHPRILEQPVAQAASAGDPVTLRVAADSEGAVTYQWQQLQPAAGSLSAAPAAASWVDLAGATSATYALASTQTFHAGSYRALITASNVTIPSAAVTVTVDPAPPSAARLLNLSTRAQALTGSEILIPGFVVSGTADKRLLIRAVGPTLALPQYGVPGTLANPRLALKRLDPSTPQPTYVDIAANDDWQDNANAAAITQTAADLSAFPFADDREAALLIDLAPGQYTIFADGVPATSSGQGTNDTGVAIVELYDADSASVNARLINISNRGFVGTGAQVMIPGFVISSEGPKTLLVRVVGPTLAPPPYNVAGTMVDPRLQLFRKEADGSDTLLLGQDNWNDGLDAANTRQTALAVGAFALAEGSNDAAFVVTLNPGVYTVVGSAADGTSSGVVLVEVYVVP